MTPDAKAAIEAAALEIATEQTGYEHGAGLWSWIAEIIEHHCGPFMQNRPEHRHVFFASGEYRDCECGEPLPKDYRVVTHEFASTTYNPRQCWCGQHEEAHR